MRIKYIIIAILLYLLVGCQTYCVSNPAEAVVYIDSRTSTGSGVLLGDGIVLTAAHVLEDAHGGLTARHIDGEIYRARDMFIDDHRDIGFFRIDYDGPGLPLGDSAGLQPGCKISLIGHPRGIGWWHSYGRIAKEPFNSDIYMDIAGNPGNSGCPVLNTHNEIVGILTCGYRDFDGLTMGVESDYIAKVLAVYEHFVDLYADSPFIDFGKEWPKELPIIKKVRAIVEVRK